MEIGTFGGVKEVPGGSLTEREWSNIQLARRSYPAIRGSAANSVIEDDPAVGHDPRLYDTSHYIVENDAARRALAELQEAGCLTNTDPSPDARACDKPLSWIPRTEPRSRILFETGGRVSPSR